MPRMYSCGKAERFCITVVNMAMTLFSGKTFFLSCKAQLIMKTLSLVIVNVLSGDLFLAISTCTCICVINLCKYKITSIELHSYRAKVRTYNKSITCNNMQVNYIHIYRSGDFYSPKVPKIFPEVYVKGVQRNEDVKNYPASTVKPAQSVTSNCR